MQLLPGCGGRDLVPSAFQVFVATGEVHGRRGQVSGPSFQAGPCWVICKVVALPSPEEDMGVWGAACAWFSALLLWPCRMDLMLHFLTQGTLRF
jgi:hypothetical protein